VAGTRKQRKSFGSTRKLASGRWQARYTHPITGARVNAPTTFDAKKDADAWLSRVQTEIRDGALDSVPRRTRITFGDYADQWLEHRDLRPRTRAEYKRLLDGHIRPTFGDASLTSVTPADVRQWYSGLDSDSPVQRARAYGLLRTIFGTAVTDELIPANPCRIKGASKVKRSIQITVLEPAEVDALAAAMPDRLAAMVQLSFWAALRFGETVALTRDDLDLEARTVNVRRAVVRADGEVIVGDPKTAAGRRVVHLPPHIVGGLKRHLDTYVEPKGSALLFPATTGDYLSPSSVYWHWKKATAKIGRPDLRLHDLRHGGATWAARAGASVVEVMARVGHTSPAMSLRYMHASQDRDAAIAAALSKMVDED
jgi:integrase